MSGLHIEGAAAPEATPTADAALVAGLVDRAPAAVADLYDRYAERLLGFCTGMLRDPHEAADALHDTILVAADRIGQLRDPGRLRPWLYAIARTQCLARLRRRERTAVAEDPTVLVGGRPMGTETAPDGDGARVAEGTEAAELVWAAAEGLDEGDRVLLELDLRQGLSGNELAAAAGVRPGQISMVTGRMRQRLERALGALLVARHGRRDCAELGAILGDWDGRLTVLLRKRVARHVDRCEVCDERRSGLVAPLGTLAVGAPAVLATADLRTAVVAGAGRIWGGEPAPDVTEVATWDGDGFPPDPPSADRTGLRSGSARRRGALVVAAAVVLVVGGLVAGAAATGSGDGDVRADGVATASDADPDAAPAPGAPGADPTTTAADEGADADPSSTAVPPTVGTAPVQPGPTSTTGPPLAGGPGGPAAGPTAPDPGGPVVPGPAPGPSPSPGPAPAPAPAPTAPPNPPPTIGALHLSPGGFQTTCNPDNDSAVASATVTDTGGALSVRLHHSGPGGATGVPMGGAGSTRTATLQGFTTPGSYTWWVTASDGTSTTTSAPQPFTVDPCAG
ncbi:sigma-70 family RNA polymerase sigma factor [Iamia sp. SCSIO 61187]|uniref:RNA polymerase sigma factor n=1 Tax=Iamia sp. SCSIO 61187 TaxID=2722752 RepID=UPI001C62BF0C|nr:sigma-70 family RNA polymerase sigma factor [Iamia sp. SCSIO 61187]QYG95012.1 sigma-70 family RNA polymerase sigma factor [Iamia sp. SCSIO 61187]